MALVAERWGLIPELKRFAAEQRPIWGTCAGLIFLANRASGGRHGTAQVGMLTEPAGMQPSISQPAREYPSLASLLQGGLQTATDVQPGRLAGPPPLLGAAAPR
jgi:hypothetical protein